MALGHGGGGHGGGGHGGHGGHGHGGGRGGFFNPAFPYYYDDGDDYDTLVYDVDSGTPPTSSFYRGYVITLDGRSYTVSKAGSTDDLGSFGTYDEARAFIDATVDPKSVNGFGDTTPGAVMGAGDTAVLKQFATQQAATSASAWSSFVPKLMTVGALAAGVYFAFFHEPKGSKR
jgi:hypothetical protein